MPGIQSSLIILEGNGQVLFSLFVRPCDDGFALAVEAYPLLDDFILEEIMKPIRLANEHHLIEALRLVFNTKVAGAKVVPPTITIQLVKLGTKLVGWFPAKLNNSIIKSNFFIDLSHDWDVFIKKLWLISQEVVLEVETGVVVDIIQVILFSLMGFSVLLVKLIRLVVY